MILRTPPVQKKRRPDDSAAAGDRDSPVSDLRLVVYNDAAGATAPADEDGMVCTYHCRQMVKSEFMVAFNNAEKQLLECQAQLETLKRQLSESESDRKKCKDKLCYLQQELEAYKGREHGIHEQLQKEIEDSMERHREQLKKCSELEAQLRKETDSRKNAGLLVQSEKDKVAELDVKLQRLNDNSEREKNRLQRELKHLKDDSELSAHKMTSDLERMQLRAENSEKESKLLKEQLEDLRRQLDESLHKRSEVEKLAAEATLHETTPSKDSNLLKHLQEELRNCESELQEARKLKSSHVNCEFLKEKLLEEKAQRERVEMELSKLQKFQLQAHELELELLSWKSLLQEIPGVSCLSDIPLQFAELQKETITRMTEIGEVKAQLKKLEVSLDLAEQKRETAEKESAMAKEKGVAAALEVKRLELRLSSVSEERDRLKRDASMLNKQKNGEEESGSATERLVQDLESSLKEREQTIRELEESLHGQRELINRQLNEMNTINEKLSAEAKKVKFLEREGDRLRSEIALLESKLGHGDYSAATTKVLRMVNTLGVDGEAQQTIEALRAELKKTQEKLQALKELKGQSDVGTIIDAGIPEKLAQLKGQIAVLEKREERYKAVFAERISVFRRACCSLFGYKIVMDDHQRPNGIPVTHFTLQSIYAQSDDEKLEFEYESGNTIILVNEYSSQPEVSHQIEVFIKKMSSIPAFTANLTMESFNKRTLS